MKKTIINKENDTAKPFTDSDTSVDNIAKCDTIENNEIILSQNDIANLIMTIRGSQVLIDKDLAGIYKVGTKRLNEQVRRNIERFPERYRFQLTKEEMMKLVANCDRFKSLKHSTSPPYAFTVYGVSMLPSVIHTQKAVETSIKIIDAFVAMRNYIVQNANVLIRISHLEKHQIETDEKIDAILDRMNQNYPQTLSEQVFPTGCVWDAWAYVSNLIRYAKRRIILIDNYVDDRVLTMLSKRADNVTATIYTRYNERFLTDLKKHNTQYPEVQYIQLPCKNHDRFLIIDDKVHFLGASLKDIGSGLCAVSEMSISPETLIGFLK